MRNKEFGFLLKKICFAAMLAAMSVVLGVLAKLIFGAGPYRVTFEGLPILFGGITLGPLFGVAIALVADLSSCILAGQSPLPLISVGAAAIGLIAGILGRYLFKKHTYPQILLTEAAAQLVGSVVIKSLGLYLVGYSFAALLPRLPVYIGIICVESYLIYVLLHNRQIMGSLQKMSGAPKAQQTAEGRKEENQ